MTDTPRAVIEAGPEMVEAVMKEFEADNPGLSADAMTSEEFADRMMKKMSDAIESVH